MYKKGDKEASLKKSLERNRASFAPQAAEPEAATESVRVTDFQGHTKEIIASRFADIIAAMVQKSAQGSLSHTKYLFEIGGVKEELLRQSENNGEPTLAEILMAEVRRHRDEETTNSAEPVGDKSEAKPTGYLVERGGDCGAKAQ